jgi:hypothetical protein
MSVAQQIFITGGAYLLMQSYAFGVVKYRQMMTSPDTKANLYVNMSHHSPLPYITACLLLWLLAGLSVFPQALNTAAAAAVMTFYIAANLVNVVNAFKGINHTVLKDAKNQPPLKRALRIYMVFLIGAQVGGSLIIVVGGLVGLYR